MAQAGPSNVRGNQWNITGVEEYILGNGVECWVVMNVNERGEKWPHGFPKFTLEQRIAEYDLDPTDAAGALEMVLHEPHIPDPVDFRNFANDAAAKAGLKVASKRQLTGVRMGVTVPVHLGNAPDRATARQAHQARVAEVKTRFKINSGKGAGILSKGDTTDPLLEILDNHGVDPERVKVRAQYVEALMGHRAGDAKAARLMIPTPGGLPVPIPDSRPADIPYDTSVRRRGLTVALLDT